MSEIQRHGGMVAMKLTATTFMETNWNPDPIVTTDGAERVVFRSKFPALIPMSVTLR